MGKKLETYNKGNILVVFLSLFTLIIILLSLSIYILFMQVNAVIYNIKSDIYLFGKTAIINMNKKEAEANEYSIDINELKLDIMKLIRKNYSLDENLNGSNIISNIELIECTHLEKGKVDKYTNRYIDKSSIHIVVNVKLKPIVFEYIFKTGINYRVHNDIKLEFLET